MLKVIAAALAYMALAERVRFFAFLVIRALVAFLDLLGILAIGFLATSIALFIASGSDANRMVTMAGISLPAITANSLPFVASLILVLFVSKAAISIVTTWLQAKFLANIEARAARDVVRNTLANGLSTARLQSIEEIKFAVQLGSPGLFNLILNSVISVSAEAFLFLLVIASFFVVDPISAVATIVYFAIVAAGLQTLTGKMVAKASQENVSQVIAADTSLNNVSAVLKESSVMGRTNHFIEKIYTSRKSAAASSAKLYVLSGMPRYVVETSLIVAVSAFVLYQTTRGDLIAGASAIAVFLAGGLRLTASLMPLQTSLLTITQTAASAKKTLHLLDLGIRKLNLLDTVAGYPKPGPASVSLKHVSFKYESSEFLNINDLSLEISPGQQIALIGPSGAGKSTVADLILGLLEPTAGTIEINEMTPGDALISSPGLLGYVPQQPGIISGTIEENIALGMSKEEVDHAQLSKAIDQAHLNEVIEQLSTGKLTDLGNRKDELSGGQLQRMGLARALYCQPGLLVLDEATSALDAHSENEITSALEEMKGQVTVLLIAHRLNSLRNADVVYYIENGRLEDSGTLMDLVQKNEKVRKLAELMSVNHTD